MIQTGRSTLLVPLALVAGLLLLVYWFPGIAHIDTRTRRQAIASHVRDLVARIQSEPDNSKFVDELVMIAKGNYSFGATLATVALGKIGENAEPVVDQIGDLLFSEDPYVSREAAFALARLGPIAKSQLPKLLRAINDPDFQADYAAYEAIGSMGEDAVDTLPFLLRKSEDGVSVLAKGPLCDAIRNLESFVNGPANEQRSEETQE